MFKKMFFFISFCFIMSVVLATAKVEVKGSEIVWTYEESIICLQSTGTVSPSALKLLTLVVPRELLWETGKLAGIQGMLLAEISSAIPLWVDQIHISQVVFLPGMKWPSMASFGTFWINPAFR